MKPLASPPHICLITEGKATPENYGSERRTILERVFSAVSDGVGLIQIREKSLGGRLLLDLTRSVIDALAGKDAVILVNERADVAAAAGADGVHLPEHSLPPRVVCESFPELLVGVSTHSIETARYAVKSGAGYLFFGPVFSTPGKGDPVGTSELGEVCRAVDGFPVIAIGGIDEANLEETLSVGAAGIAAIRALNNADTRRLIFSRLKTDRGAVR